MEDDAGDVENQYYKAKCVSSSSCRTSTDCPALKEDDPQGALKAFRTIVDDQPEKGEW